MILPAADEEPGVTREWEEVTREWEERCFLMTETDHHGEGIQNSFVKRQILTYGFRQALLYCPGYLGSNPRFTT